MDVVTEMGPVMGVVALCAALGLSRATFYRHLPQAAALPEPSGVSAEAPGVAVVASEVPGVPEETLEGTLPVLEVPGALETVVIASVAVPPGDLDTVAKPPKRVPRRLSRREHDDVLAQLNGPRFVDLSPGEVYATLLDEGIYLSSERTMYRILAAHAEVRERRNQRRHPIYAAPELLAVKANQIWSWDITKLRGPGKGDYFHLYVMIDLYSRYVVGWFVSLSESAAQAEQFIDETCARHGILRGQLTIHADRGTSMKSKPVALLLADLGVIKSHSRPSVSNDNPYSEAQFKTLKYRPDFPDRFGSLEDARAHVQRFVAWYNTQHHHTGIASLTPHDVFHGHAEARIQGRAAVLDAAYAAHPERFVRAPPSPAQLPAAVWINKPNATTENQKTRDGESVSN